MVDRPQKRRPNKRAGRHREARQPTNAALALSGQNLTPAQQRQTSGPEVGQRVLGAQKVDF
jgi:hypothetical protein